MAKKVELLNTSGQTIYVEFGKRNNLIGNEPRAFDNKFDGHAQLALIDVYGMLFPNGNANNKPLSYMRHYDVMRNKYRFANILELGDHFLATQKGVYHSDTIANSDTPVQQYQKLSDDPVVYGFGSDERFVECRFYEDFLTIKEGDFLDLKYEPWPFTIYDHQSLYNRSSVIFQPSTISGTLDGKPILGLGSFDRFYISKNGGDFSSVEMGYICLMAMGIREDGRKEFFITSASINGVGKTALIYSLEGETPIITDHFTMEADWHRLPYVDDGTCIFNKATIYFCDKEIHFEAKWGQKGYTEKPRIEKHGQAQISGDWYVGKTPYKYRMSYAGSEVMDAFDYKLKELGFDVVD